MVAHRHDNRQAMLRQQVTPAANQPGSMLEQFAAVVQFFAQEAWQTEPDQAWRTARARAMTHVST